MEVACGTYGSMIWVQVSSLVSCFSLRYLVLFVCDFSVHLCIDSVPADENRENVYAASGTSCS